MFHLHETHSFHGRRLDPYQYCHGSRARHSYVMKTVIIVTGLGYSGATQGDWGALRVVLAVAAATFGIRGIAAVAWWMSGEAEA
jgi:hypothetical protein